MFNTFAKVAMQQWTMQCKSFQEVLVVLNVWKFHNIPEQPNHLKTSEEKANTIFFPQKNPKHPKHCKTIA